MADITSLTALAAPSTDDIIYIVDDPGGTPADRKITVANLFGSPPAIGGTTAAAGSFTTLGATGNVTIATTLFYGTDLQIRNTTSDASDTGSVLIGGGGTISTTRGAYVGVYGNEHGSQAGNVLLQVGEAGDIVFRNTASGTAAIIDGAAGALRVGTTSATTAAGEVLRAHRAVGGLGDATAWLTSGDGSATVLGFGNVTTGSDTTDGFRVGISGGELATLWNYESTAMQFATANTERARIASNCAAIGIGTTDVETHNASYAAIEFGESLIMAHNSDPNLSIGANFYLDAGGSWRYKATDLSARLGINDAFTWYTAASGTADALVTWSTRMTLTNAGNLLVGTVTDVTTGVGCLALGNQTAPSAVAANSFALYSSDLSAGNTIPSFWTEGSGIYSAGTPAAATGSIAIRVNGTVYHFTVSTTAAS